MLKFLDDEHMSGAAAIKKKAVKMIKDGKCGDITEKQFNETMNSIQPLMVYALKRGIWIGVAAGVAGMAIARGSEAYGPRIREAVMKKLSK